MPPLTPFARSLSAFEALTHTLSGGQASAWTHAELEEHLEAAGRELLRRLLQDHLDQRARQQEEEVRSGVGPVVTGPEGQARPWRESGHSRPGMNGDPTTLEHAQLVVPRRQGPPHRRDLRCHHRHRLPATFVDAPARKREIRDATEGVELAECWLLAEWPTEAEPVQFGLSDLPATTALTTLVRLAKLRWRIEHDYREMKQALGLANFEGRTFNGWHHHVTLVSLAHAFCTLRRLATAPRDTAPA